MCEPFTDDTINNIIMKVNDIVIFQAYKDCDPIEATIKRKGTLKELNKYSINENDKRIFYELENKNKQIFTCTTSQWIKKK